MQLLTMQHRTMMHLTILHLILMHHILLHLMKWLTMRIITKSLMWPTKSINMEVIQISTTTTTQHIQNTQHNTILTV